MSSKKITWEWLSAVILSLFMFSIPAFAGDLNPGAPPAPTMKTLDQIPPTWDQALTSSERFKLVLGGAGVLDKETGLVWEQSPGTVTYTWDWSGNNAAYSCINKAVGGRKGWRLPSLQELASLLDTSVSGTPKLPIGHPFTNVQSSYYWSATTFADGPAVAWSVDIASGLVSTFNKIAAYPVWCVRGGQGNDAQ